jgi:hypothetical protein
MNYVDAEDVVQSWEGFGSKENGVDQRKYQLQVTFDISQRKRKEKKG